MAFYSTFVADKLDTSTPVYGWVQDEKYLIYRNIIKGLMRFHAMIFVIKNLNDHGAPATEYPKWVIIDSKSVANLVKLRHPFNVSKGVNADLCDPLAP